MKHKRMVLVLNKNWLPISIVPYTEAFRLMCKEHAAAIDTDTEGDTPFMMFDIGGWIDLHSKSKYSSVSTVKFEIAVPEIIVLTKYENMPKHKITLSKKNILIRDNFTCAYCGCEVTEATGTVDHIYPQTLGGKTSWDNCITACKRCNHTKGCNLPEGQFSPKFTAKEPFHLNPIYRINHSIKGEKFIVPDSWKKMLFMD